MDAWNNVRNNTIFRGGGTHYSLPIYNGVVTFLQIAIAGALLINLFDIKKKVGMVSIAGIMVMFPTITSLFCGYMYTTPYYLFAVALSVAGTFLVCRYKNALSLFFGSILIAMAIGVYQPYLPLVLTIMVMYMLKQVSERENSSWKLYFKEAIYYIVVCCFSVGIWYVVTQFSLNVLDLQLDGYKDIDKLNMTSLQGYYERMRLAYTEFVSPTTEPDFIGYNMYRGTLNVLYKILLIFDFLVCVYYFLIKKKGIAGKIQCGILLLLIPLSVNFIFIMINRWYIYSLMVYAQIMLFVFTIWLAEKTAEEECLWLQKGKYYIGVGIVLAACVLYWRYDNVCYLKAELMQAQMDSYLTTLVTRIQSIEEYEESKPIVFVNASDKTDENWPEIKQFEEIDILPFDWDTIINDNSWIEYMKYRCGFEPLVLDAEKYEQMDEVLHMPSYPNSGSIQEIEDVIVVKF